VQVLGTHHATTAVSGLLIKFKQYEMDPNQTPSYFKKDTPPSANLEHVTCRSRFSVRLTQTLPAKNFSKFYFKRLFPAEKRYHNRPQGS